MVFAGYLNICFTSFLQRYGHRTLMAVAVLMGSCHLSILNRREAMGEVYSKQTAPLKKIWRAGNGTILETVQDKEKHAKGSGVEQPVIQ